MKVLLFGRLADGVGREIAVPIDPGASIAQLRTAIIARHPAIEEPLARSRACVGGLMVGDDHRASSDDAVEFLPPVSGG